LNKVILMSDPKTKIYPGVEFIKKLTTEYRKNLSEIIKNLVPEIYECVTQAGFRVNKNDANLYRLKIEKANDFASIGGLFTNKIFENRERKTDREGKLVKLSLSTLKSKFQNMDNEFDKAKLQQSLTNENFDSKKIFSITKIILDIREVRNDLEHEDVDNDYTLSQAFLMHSLFYRLMDLIPVHIKEASDDARELEKFLKESHLKMIKTSYEDSAFENDESQDEKIKNIDLENLEKNINELRREVRELSISKDREIHSPKSSFHSVKEAKPLEFLRGSKEEKDYLHEEKERDYLDKELNQMSKELLPEEYLREQSYDFLNKQYKNKLSKIGVLKKSESEVKKELTNLGRKIYTLMNNEMNFDWWDCILNSRIMNNIIKHKIYDAEEFKLKDICPGYLFKTKFKDLGEFTERDKQSKEIMDLQIKLFWKEIQDVIKSHLYFDYILNSNNFPWKKTSPVFIKNESNENKKIREDVINYLEKNDPKRINQDIFSTFSTSYVRKFKETMDQFPEIKFTWGEIEYQKSLTERPYNSDEIFTGHFIQVLK